MKKFKFIIALILFVQFGHAQKYFSKNAVLKFHSDSPMEKIEAVNSTASTVIDISSGKIEFAALNNAFVFEKALMQDHFNENYMESTKFPKTVFKGTIQDVSKLNLTATGTYKVMIQGDLMMHGVTKSVSVPAEFVVDSKGVHANAKFTVKCSDFDIKIPAVVKNNISNDVDITVKVDYNLLNL
ncbi:MAG: YceI family protein [Saprospiraceae bacterium]|nr:YceI family protein [Saprospiraceae bacterium]